MNEEEIVESTPTETMESDDSFFSEVDNEILSENITEEEDENISEEETNETQKPTEEQEDNSEDNEEVDLQPLLKALSGKIKYNKEEVNVKSIEDLVAGYQKGLNYDKKLQELEDLQKAHNTRLEQYAQEKADSLGISVDEYMDRVEKYEEQQKRQQELDELNELVDAGAPESLAKELIAGREQRRQLQKELAEIRAEREASKKEAEKDKEYQDFITQFPDVKPDDIPKEVFEEAEKTTLTNAYMKWKLKDLENQLSVVEKNEKNSKSAIGRTTDNGTVKENHKRDFFLEGFES